MLVCCPPVVAAKRRAQTPRRIPRPVNPSEVAIYPFTLVMTDGENHRDLLTRLSTALAMTEAAHLEPGVGGTSRAVALTRAMLHTCL
jgi:hypothetical protein